MAQDTILVEKDGHVATITMNRPDVLNALAHEQFEALQDAWRALNDDDDVRAVIVTGAGRGFCSGADLINFDLSSREGRRPVIGASQDWLKPLLEIKQPTIAAVNGVAVGAGLGIALACDIRIASEAARFSAIFKRIGMVATDGVAWLLPRHVGLGKTFELVYSGDIIDAREAERIGMVNEVVPADRLMDRAREMAQSIADGPPLALQLSKKMIYGGLSLSYEEYLVTQQYSSLVNRTYASHDIQEGARASKEKRPPRFRGMTGAPPA